MQLSQYSSAANPLTVRRYGVIGTEADGTEEFGLFDDLVFAYEGNRVQTIANAPEGEDFYGRTGYGTAEGESAYAWNDQGYMTADSSRGITNIRYNHQGLPVQTRFSNGDMTVCSYDASGLLTQSVSMGRRFALRDYVADRVFSTGELLYSYFPGGYFDADGVPHYLHADYQGSVVMVTDSAGTIEQHTTYYPYGEPHRAPSGQPILYGGKERLATTDDYNFDARRYHAPAINWPTPDPMASKFVHLSPYAFCAANPIQFIDPDGCEIRAMGKDDAEKLVEDLKAIFSAGVFEKFRDLIVRSGKNQNGKSIAPISQEALSEAFAGITLNEDQQALVDITVNTINSNDVHKIKYVNYSGKFSRSVSIDFAEYYDTPAININAVIEEKGGIPGFFAYKLRGEGQTIQQKHGTYSLVFNEPELHANGRSVTVGHELFGHGRSLALGRGQQNQHVDAIQTENLILRVMGIPYINDGSNHGPKTIIPNPSDIPNFR